MVKTSAKQKTQKAAPTDDDDQQNPLKQQLRRLHHSITKGAPYCQGTLTLPNSDFTLFYGKEGHAGYVLQDSRSVHESSDSSQSRLNLSTATETQLQHLSSACEPATFGLNQQDVHDETYRKAGKLDKTDFSPAFDALRAGLIKTVEEELVVPRYRKDITIRAEMYKLNVYGELVEYGFLVGQVY